MIKINGSKVFASTSSFVYEEVEVAKIKKSSHYILSMHTGFGQYDFVPISVINTKEAEGQMIKLVIENTIGRKYTLEVESSQKIYTKVRGYVPAYRINTSDVLLDYENRTCKLISATKYDSKQEPVFDIRAGYNLNYICNGILVRSN